MNVIRSEIPDVVLIEPKVFSDDRGFFFESYNKQALKSAIGLDCEFVQDNYSRSRRHVLRGLHYQFRQPQGKLVSVVSGRVWDVAVDIRRNSPSFGRWVGFELSADSPRVVWIPPGFAHGFLVLSDHADVAYKTTSFYAPEFERVLLWNDPKLAINWPLDAPPVLAMKDKNGSPLEKAELFS